MAEGIILRRGGGSGSLDVGKIHTEIYIKNGTFIAPVTGKYSILLFGGGGAGITHGGGGGGGDMNAKTIALTKGTSVAINIGLGGINGNAGGTTFFGSYLSANGGEAGKGNSGGNGGTGGGGYDGGRGGKGYYGGGGGGGGADCQSDCRE